MLFQNNVQIKTAAVLFGGIGGESAGLLRSQIEYGGKLYRFKLLCSIDSDPIANLNHDLITGEYIGNVVPRDSAEQMGNVILLAVAESEAGIDFALSWEPVWVAPQLEDMAVQVH